MNNELFTILGLLVVTIVAVVSAYAVTYLAKLKKLVQSEVDKIEDDKLREVANNALQRITEIAISVVDSFQQEIVGAIRKGIEEGTHTKQDLYDLRDKAVERVLSQITNDVREAAMLQIKDIKGYIEDLVSQEVLNLRSQDIE